jgi:predicted transcriptional regulator
MPKLFEMVAEIVSSHVCTTPMCTDELLEEIQKVYATLQAIETGKGIVTPAGEKVKPESRSRKHSRRKK